MRRGESSRLLTQGMRDQQVDDKGLHLPQMLAGCHPVALMIPVWMDPSYCGGLFPGSEPVTIFVEIATALMRQRIIKHGA